MDSVILPAGFAAGFDFAFHVPYRVVKIIRNLYKPINAYFPENVNTFRVAVHGEEDVQNLFLQVLIIFFLATTGVNGDSSDSMTTLVIETIPGSLFFACSHTYPSTLAPSTILMATASMEL